MYLQRAREAADSGVAVVEAVAAVEVEAAVEAVEAVVEGVEEADALK